MTITLEKRTEQATASLVNLLKTQQQKGIDLGDLTAQVEIAIDYSGSMSARYPDEVQQGAKKALFGRGVDLEAERDGDPKLVLFVTDGDPSRSDRPKIERLLASASSGPIFWQFIGLGPRSQLDYIQQLNKGIEGAVIDNVGVTLFEDTRGLTDEAFFDDVIREFFTVWLPEARRLGIIRK